MVFGGVATERLALNDDTLWPGGLRDWNNPRARAVLPELLRLLAVGRGSCGATLPLIAKQAARRRFRR